MKLLTIVVKPSRSDGVKRALSTIGTGGATIISAQGFGRKEVLIDCNPKQVSMIAVGNSISQYLKVISENIHAGISRIK